MALPNESNRGEVSRIMAKIIGIHDNPTSSDTTVYDPTCGSASLLLKIGEDASTPVTLHGQEKALGRRCSAVPSRPPKIEAHGLDLQFSRAAARQAIAHMRLHGAESKENMGVAPLIDL